ncbi:MAG: IS30 family transposase [Candidatus Synoicihabitans palmerolidicus]|nr:IS30 family transposase [Candidatus Synoicihabitans palmerolidicus]
MAQHAAFSLATKVAVYFCNPHSPWQRGAVANINDLIREYFPKGIDFNTVTKGQIAKAEWLLNNLLRIGLDGPSPAEVLSLSCYYYTKGLCTSRLTPPTSPAFAPPNPSLTPNQIPAIILSVPSATSKGSTSVMGVN